ncbi:MAG: hypothetical protein EZS28_005567 [Streblomastix strix]|uniref:Protein kinase domain-containing protein n=1 Tax=Streblomastix strix TaxID=222440 RepID=A0A5J4WXE6_9EUKA|nr:MAG: hypothetical protein EZS28_005567 [Streblomastix strix]
MDNENQVLCAITRNRSNFNQMEWAIVNELAKEEKQGEYSDFIVKYISLSKTPSFYIIFTKYYGEKNLEDLSLAGVFANNEICTSVIIGNILEGVNEFHKRGFSHGNLKANNIYITEVGPDKSIAVVTNLSCTQKIGQTQRIQQNIPLQLLPPECLQGQPFTPQSDLYMIGIIMYSMLFKRLPYTSQTYQELLNEQQSGPPNLDKLFLGTNSALCTLLAYDPNQRSSCEQLLQNSPLFNKQVDINLMQSNPQFAAQLQQQRVYQRGCSTIPTHILAQPMQPSELLFGRQTIYQPPVIKSGVIPPNLKPVAIVQPSPVIIQPQPVIIQPQPVIIQPQPVYVQPGLIRPINSVPEDPGFECEECHKKFTFDQYKDHIQQQHYGSPLYNKEFGRNPVPSDESITIPCESCKQQIPFSKFEEHMKGHQNLRIAPVINDQDVTIPCDRCKQQIPFSQYDEHIKGHLSQRNAPPINDQDVTIPCDRCHQQIPFSQYEQHFATHQ